LDPTVCDRDPHRTLKNLYKSLIAIRKRFALGGKRPETRCDKAGKSLTLDYRGQGAPLLAYFHFGDSPARIELPPGSFRLLLCSSPAAIAGMPSESEDQPVSGALTMGRRSFAAFELLPSGEES
jgi:hypothetical protein